MNNIKNSDNRNNEVQNTQLPQHLNRVQAEQYFNKHISSEMKRIIADLLKKRSAEIKELAKL